LSGLKPPGGIMSVGRCDMQATFRIANETLLLRSYLRLGVWEGPQDRFAGVPCFSRVRVSGQAGAVQFVHPPPSMALSDFVPIRRTIHASVMLM